MSAMEQDLQYCRAFRIDALLAVMVAQLLRSRPGEHKDVYGEMRRAAEASLPAVEAAAAEAVAAAGGGAEAAYVEQRKVPQLLAGIAAAKLCYLVPGDESSAAAALSLDNGYVRRHGLTQLFAGMVRHTLSERPPDRAAVYRTMRQHIESQQKQD
eukprot:TRINITY_DN12304_c0_g1_i1.p2 TRINITY_DN12304_c0_g1~~TRINITY_DN12304_c0_g1_i1.p2  ORF type:complete len:155 (+),score=57.73 TRINITY_DN12304_c0_g1_i1:108-572(+)